jgi:hypothetical protein
MFQVMGDSGRGHKFERVRQRALVSCLAVGVWLAPSLARADVAACVAAHSHGQAERNAGRLQSAKADFISCSTAGCPSEIQSECASFLAEVEGFMASVVFAAVDEEGHDATDVKVTVDGQVVVDKLTGLATTLDPGSHEIMYTWPDGFQQKQTVVVAQGEKNRRVELRREPKPVAAPKAPPLNITPKKTPVLAYVLTGVGALALGSFAAFAITGKSAEHEMDGCKPYCKQSQADKMRLRYLIADISLGVGVVSLGAGGYLFLSASASHEPTGTALGGGSVSYRGSF